MYSVCTVVLCYNVQPSIYSPIQGEDLGPLELKVEGLQKQIDNSVDRCTQMQQFWLRQQTDLVKKTRKSDEQSQAVDSLKKQLLILDQKKIRTDGMYHCNTHTVQ